jgi:hypothetical protein
MTNQADPDRLAAIPVTVADQDRVLVRHRDIVVAVAGVRAFPQAVMFQLLIKTRFADGGSADFSPNLVFGLSHLLRPGNFEFGAELRGSAGDWQPTEVHFAGGGGGGEAEPGSLGSYEFKWWVPLSAHDRGLRLWCVWEECGIAKSTAELDVDRILTASRASQPQWIGRA